MVFLFEAEGYFDIGSHIHRLAVELAGLKTPVPKTVECRFIQSVAESAQHFYILQFPILADNPLDQN